MMPGMNKKALALLGLGHLMVDLNTGALPALLPFLKTSFGLSYTMIGALVLVANMTSSIISTALRLSVRPQRPSLAAAVRSRGRDLRDGQRGAGDKLPGPARSRLHQWDRYCQLSPRSL